MSAATTPNLCDSAALVAGPDIVLARISRAIHTIPILWGLEHSYRFSRYSTVEGGAILRAEPSKLALESLSGKPHPETALNVAWHHRSVFFFEVVVP